MKMPKRELPWYKNWFDDKYLLLYKHRDDNDAREQVGLIIDTLKPGKNNSILDLGCGEGRYTFFFKDLGYRIIGLDLSETLIRNGRTKYPHLNVVVGDMRHMPFLPGKFDLVLSLFTSFGYFEKDEENERVLGSVYYFLKPGGIFWLDFLNSYSVKKNLVPENSSQIHSFFQVIEKRKIEGKRIIKDIYFLKLPLAATKPTPAASAATPPRRGMGSNRCHAADIPEGRGGLELEKGVTAHYRESVRLFTRGELEMMLEKAGFRVEGCFGSYQGQEWREESERTILFGRKRN